MKKHYRQKNNRFKNIYIDEISVLELAKMYGISESRVYEIIRKSCGKLYRNEDFKKMKVYLR